MNDISSKEMINDDIYNNGLWIKGRKKTDGVISYVLVLVEYTEFCSIAASAMFFILLSS